jgi:hypothetical protein
VFADCGVLFGGRGEVVIGCMKLLTWSFGGSRAGSAQIVLILDYDASELCWRSAREDVGFWLGV